MRRYTGHETIDRTPRTFAKAKAFGYSKPPNLIQEKRPADASHFSWLGRRDSNPRMSAPKTDALPLGDAPTTLLLYHMVSVNPDKNTAPGGHWSGALRSGGEN